MERIQDSLKKKNRLARPIFKLAVRVGWRRFEHAQGRARWTPSLWLWPMLDRKVARNVTDKLGGRLKLAISGGAALSPEIARMFIGLGVPIIQGYGLTEASPVVCVNRPESNIPSSIGPPLHGIEVKIGDNDELLTRSRCVMRGYWQDEAATRAMIDSEGWLHSGDQVTMDAWGHYHITGRIKDIIVLNNGEKVPPTDMESAILPDPLFEQVMVVGEGRPYLAALTVLNEEHWQEFAAHLNVDPRHPDALRDSRVMKALTHRVAHHLRHFPGYAQIRRLHPELSPWTLEDGLLTPTLKIKRNQVLDRIAQRSRPCTPISHADHIKPIREILHAFVFSYTTDARPGTGRIRRPGPDGRLCPGRTERQRPGQRLCRSGRQCAGCQHDIFQSGGDDAAARPAACTRRASHQAADQIQRNRQSCGSRRRQRR